MVKQEPTDYTYDPGKCRLVFSISDYHYYQVVIEPQIIITIKRLLSLSYIRQRYKNASLKQNEQYIKYVMQRILRDQKQPVLFRLF